MMWTKEEIDSINPLSEGQNRSVLDYLYETGAATPDLLCDAAGILETLDHPHVMTFCLLPIVFNVDEEGFVLDSWGDSVPPIELRFKGVFLSMNSNGTIVQSWEGTSAAKEGTLMIAPATLVLGIIPLWGKRRILYSKYESCLSEKGLKDRVIGERKPWMELPIEANSGPLSAKAFENELTVRVKAEVIFALGNFCNTYELAQMHPVPNNLSLYSYFAMTYPGRITTGGLPLPLYFSLKELIPKASPTRLNRNLYQKCLASRIGKEDRIVRQLISMAKLVEQGEPELAIVGAASSLEWFFNTTFPQFARTSKDGRQFQLPLSKCIRKKVVTDILPLPVIEQIEKIVETRNKIAHGEPPLRANGEKLGNFARSSLDACLNAYRLINLNAEFAQKRLQGSG